MITILTSFKPFHGDDAIRQTNALLSWRALGQEVEIVAFGKTPNLDASAEKFRIRQVTEIACFENRLPLIEAIFDYGRNCGKHDLQVYVNGDLLLFDDLVTALQAIPRDKFLMTGQRMDVDVRDLLDLSGEMQRQAVRLKLAAAGCLHDVGGMDYFACRRGSIPSLPRLYVGAAGWDNALVYACRKAKVPVIDATLDVQVFHQNHDWLRLPDGTRAAYEGPAAQANRAQMQTECYNFYTTDASYWLLQGRLRHALVSPRHAWRMVLTYPLVRGWRSAFRWPFRLAAALMRRFGLIWMMVEHHRLPVSGRVLPE